METHRVRRKRRANISSIPCSVPRSSGNQESAALPLYEYACKKCGRHTERIETFKGPHMRTCPSCGGKVEQLISAPALQFKGTGWYVTDYAGKSSTGDSGKGEGGKGESGDSAKSGDGKESGSKDAKESKESKDTKETKETKDGKKSKSESKSSKEK
jgi:putative FmdB family regulatory protein